MNRVQLIGNLGVDPTLRYTPGGKAVSNFTLATNRSFKDAQGQLQQRTEWHRLVVWGRTAEVCSEYLSKGRKVFVEGSLRTRSWEDKEGIKRYTTEVYVNYVDFLGGGKKEGTKKQDQRQATGGQNEDQPGYESISSEENVDEDPPF